MSTKCIVTDRSGWLTILLLPNYKRVSVPEGLQVRYEGIKTNIPPSVKNGQNYLTPAGTALQVTPGNRYFLLQDKTGHEREFFTILEGPYRNKKACVSVQRGMSCFGTPRYTGCANLHFTLEKTNGGKTFGTLRFGTDAVPAYTVSSQPPPSGIHSLELPDVPHKWGQIYQNESESPITWFRIGNAGDRYIQPGQASNGCIAVDPAHWSKLYRYLIRSRKGDMINAGTVQVVHSKS